MSSASIEADMAKYIGESKEAVPFVLSSIGREGLALREQELAIVRGYYEHCRFCRILRMCKQCNPGLILVVSQATPLTCGNFASVVGVSHATNFLVC